jgi:mono/diheme cytochrome c family protein
VLLVGDLVARQEVAARLSPFEREKAVRILSDRLPCLGCHVIGGSGGRVGPDLTYVGERLNPDEILRRIADPQGVQPGSVMPSVPMPTSWRELIVAYLVDLPREQSDRQVPQGSIADPLPASELSSGNLDGPALYARFCTSCHGASGGGNGANASYLPVPAANHSDPKAMSQRSDDALFDTIHRGGYVMNRHPFMPAYGETLRTEEIRALVRHIRTLCDCGGPSWSLDNATSPAP